MAPPADEGRSRPARPAGAKGTPGTPTRRARPDALRVAVVAPPFLPVPPHGYGGTERVVAQVVEGLVARGHHVTLFAAAGSSTEGRLVTPLAVPPALGDPSALAEELLHVARAYRHADAFDVIHDHTGTGPLVGAGLGCPVPIVHTLHGPWTADSRRCVDLVQQRVHLVAISRAQRDANPRLDPLTHVVYNGVDLHAHHVADEKADHLVFVGRVSPEKRPELAIAVARRAGMPLVMIVKRTEPAERAYWDAAVAPLLGHDVAVLDQPPHQVKVDLVGRARALLFPIDWPEPFGLVVTEAMACGTPVVARPFGAVPEIVDHGVNGFLATTVAQMARCARQAVHLDPASCRASVAARFSAEAMVSGYEDIYRAALARRAAGRSSTSRRPPHAEPSGGTAA